GLSATQTSTITITPLDAPPTLSGIAPSATFTENDNGDFVQLTPGVTISDPDSTTITSATVSIVGGTFAGDGDLLEFSGSDLPHVEFLVRFGVTIEIDYDSATETMVFTGVGDLADYQLALNVVDFTTASDNPTDFGADPSRIVTWTVADDFNVHSAPVTTTV